MARKPKRQAVKAAEPATPAAEELSGILKSIGSMRNRGDMRGAIRLAAQQPEPIIVEVNAAFPDMCDLISRARAAQQPTE